MTRSTLDVKQENPPRTCTLHVCISCRASGTQREVLGSRAGLIFYQRLSEALKASPLNDQVNLIPAECLSVCPRPCGFALSSSEAWSYLFGDQDPNETINDVIKGVSLYVNSPDGFMPRSQRPKSMRSSILGRIPPTKGQNPCT